MGHEIDRETLDKIRGLDEKTMQDIIKKLAQASGLNEQGGKQTCRKFRIYKKKACFYECGRCE